MKKKKWVAFVRGNRWVIAKVKVAQRKTTLNILALSEYEQEEAESPVSKILKLRTWLKKKKVPLKKLEFTLSCPGVITRMITLPVLSDKDLEKLLTEQVAQYFTVNIEDYLVDYRIVEQIEDEGQKRLKVLVTALPKYHWEPMWTMWQEVGLEPKVVDLASDCLARLYARLSRRTLKKNSGEQPKDLAIVDINSDGVEFLLLEHGVFFLYSDLAADLAELPQYLEETPQDPEQAERVQLELAQTFSPVFRTLAEFLSFFAMRHFGKNVDEIYLTGELAPLPYLAELFETELEIPTHLGFIDEWKPSYGRKVKFSENGWVKYGSLYGLALRED
ncbi:type IV pilus biogenesis protein PilM [Desulfitobacterium sp.]|uniref:type IV pilus biogenesis protein PilM n=1 Tax=Desulfitobacterium sp. TaxID=49981 RepID=UPI002BB73415|nr:pilus assembly protein PilM [Desulfitobacterium sp.]HVJ48876.1 pilus assembly protein PilM [Desulfitobacterium sp.]